MTVVYYKYKLNSYIIDYANEYYYDCQIFGKGYEVYDEGDIKEFIEDNILNKHGSFDNHIQISELEIIDKKDLPKRFLLDQIEQKQLKVKGLLQTIDILIKEALDE